MGAAGAAAGAAAAVDEAVARYQVHEPLLLRLYYYYYYFIYYLFIMVSSEGEARDAAACQLPADSCSDYHTHPLHPPQAHEKQRRKHSTLGFHGGLRSHYDPSKKAKVRRPC